MGGVICACIMALRYQYSSASMDEEEQGDEPYIALYDHDKSRASNYKGMIKRMQIKKKTKTPLTLITLMSVGTKIHLNI